MTWKLKESLKSTLSHETGWVQKDWGGKSSIVLVYPNTYTIGMGNLAVHAIYELLNRHEGIVCERAFLPDAKDMQEHIRSRTPIMSIESQRPLADFDVIAFTISFENDYLNILPILRISQIEYVADKRHESAPLIIAGGAAPTLNPLPLSSIADAVVAGEMEAYECDLIRLLESRPTKQQALDALFKIEGAFMQAKDRREAFMQRRHLNFLDEYKTQTVIHSDWAQFGDMHLIEVERGCARKCRFCATPAIYGTPRHRSLHAIVEMVEEGMKHRKRIGLIGADIMSHPEFEDIAETIHARGGTFSLSSVRADAIDESKAKLLFESGHRSIAIGVEAGSQKLRARLAKGLSDEQILRAAAILAEAGLTRFRLYFMIGLPGETDDDIQAIIDFSKLLFEEIKTYAPRKRRTTAVDLTVTPFVPKPHTPFAGERFASQSEHKRKIKELKGCLEKAGGISLRTDSIVDAAVEHFLANSDEHAAAFLEDAQRLGSARKALAALGKLK
jgi:radical SAM superfamily enzyme YgiQ (UPF0313 family)